MSRRHQGARPRKFYGNSRVFNPSAPLAISPRVERLDHLGDGSLARPVAASRCQASRQAPAQPYLPASGGCRMLAVDFGPTRPRAHFAVKRGTPTSCPPLPDFGNLKFTCARPIHRTTGGHALGRGSSTPRAPDRRRRCDERRRTTSPPRGLTSPTGSVCTGDASAANAPSRCCSRRGSPPAEPLAAENLIGRDLGPMNFSTGFEEESVPR